MKHKQKFSKLQKDTRRLGRVCQMFKDQIKRANENYDEMYNIKNEQIKSLNKIVEKMKPIYELHDDNFNWLLEYAKDQSSYSKKYLDEKEKLSSKLFRFKLYCVLCSIITFILICTKLR